MSNGKSSKKQKRKSFSTGNRHKKEKGEHCLRKTGKKKEKGRHFLRKMDRKKAKGGYFMRKTGKKFSRQLFSHSLHNSTPVFPLTGVRAAGVDVVLITVKHYFDHRAGG